MKKKESIHKLRCENLEDEQFEELVEADLIDIENFLDSYVVSRVDEEKIDSTIDILKAYMPKEEVQVIKYEETFLEKIKNNIDLVKFHLD